ncbi:phosphonopyruvate decarboxylase [Limimonas halophila]|uniref:Phosphonopyruvate decarboxylase n=1 Tax=Limimonas halophila TaxID=1082479 RepID=A0A1G7M9M2_9PROT|nr:phosphonopyruvate decarboxylase [Limimonas halophila]SDF58437.1 phosphonopyruvate decarboxylase [Limimonas halophila]
MHEPGALLDTLAAHGVDFAAGVPCSLQGGVFAALEQGRADIPYVAASGEGEAVGIAAGAWLAGRRPAVLLQNSGLGNTVNPLAALTQPFGIPVLLLVSWRGQPGTGDAPQHAVMGAATHAVLSDLGIAHEELAETPDGVAAQLARLTAWMDTERRSAALIVPPGRIAEHDAGTASRVSAVADADPARREPAPHRDFRAGGAPPARAETLRAVAETLPPEAAVVATTGKIARECYALADRPRNFYVTGGMGSAAAIGLGIARAQPARPVVVLDGDGAALMRLGTLATVGAQAPARLTHVLLDNGAHDSTGGQRTANPGVDFAAVARACGYAATAACDTRDGLAEALRAPDGPALVHAHVATGALPKLGRPQETLPELAARMRAHLTATEDSPDA